MPDDGRDRYTSPRRRRKAKYLADSLARTILLRPSHRYPFAIHIAVVKRNAVIDAPLKNHRQPRLLAGPRSGRDAMSRTRRTLLTRVSLSPSCLLGIASGTLRAAVQSTPSSLGLAH
jgi:hypothetical protein